MWPPIVYMLCSVTSLLCMALLGRAYWRTRSRLLLWSAVGFVGLAFNNILLLLDLLFPVIDLALPRLIATLTGVSVLLVALVWGSEQ